MLERAPPAGLDGTGHQVAPHDVERRRPAPDPDAVAFAQRLEVVVVADRVALVLREVRLEVHPQARAVEALEASVIVHRAITDVTARELGVGARRCAVGQPAPRAERSSVRARRQAALQTDGKRHHHPLRGAARVVPPREARSRISRAR